MKILTVEDDNMIREGISEYLREERPASVGRFLMIVH